MNLKELDGTYLLREWNARRALPWHSRPYTTQEISTLLYPIDAPLLSHCVQIIANSSSLTVIQGIASHDNVPSLLSTRYIHSQLFRIQQIEGGESILLNNLRKKKSIA